MFNTIAKQLDRQSLGKNDPDFFITQEQYESFCKEHIFEQLRGVSLGSAFCKKFNVRNQVLSILGDDSSKSHIKKFFIR